MAKTKMYLKQNKMKVSSNASDQKLAGCCSPCEKIYPWHIVKLNGKDDKFYKIKTQEMYRINYQTLKLIDSYKFIEFNKWEEKLSIHKTHHVIEDRLKPYVNKPVGKTVEITPEEYKFISTTKLEKFVHNREAKLVELGFNKFGEICKAAFTMYLPSGRVLFFCVGMDNGLKTLYVTPTFKHRDSYQGCQYLSVEESIYL